MPTAVSSKDPFNPCLLDGNQQIPAKIWELLRRNDAFRAVVQKLSVLDAKARDARQRTGNPHNPAWERSRALVENVGERHPFAGVALQWLVPEPLFFCHIVGWPRGKKWKRREAVSVRFLRMGEGLTPNVNDKAWLWRNPEKLDVVGGHIVRGPEVFWTKSKVKRLRDRANALEDRQHAIACLSITYMSASRPTSTERLRSVRSIELD